MTATNERVVYRCKCCGVVIEVFLDHVGRCDVEGACPGTFHHPYRMTRCSRTLRHADVTSERVHIQPPGAI